MAVRCGRWKLWFFMSVARWKLGFFVVQQWSSAVGGGLYDGRGRCGGRWSINNDASSYLTACRRRNIDETHRLPPLVAPVRSFYRHLRRCVANTHGPFARRLSGVGNSSCSAYLERIWYSGDGLGTPNCLLGRVGPKNRLQTRLAAPNSPCHTI
jgi:hypothetical protein